VLLGSLGGLANSRRAKAALGEIFSVVIIGLTRAARVVPSHALARSDAGRQRKIGKNFGSSGTHYFAV